MAKAKAGVTKKLNFKWFKLRRNNLVIFVIAFAIVGGITLLATHAAGPTVSLETENGTITSPAASCGNDSSASNNGCVQFKIAAVGCNNTIPAYGCYITPGSVGYKPSMCTLTVYNQQPTNTQVTIGGSVWTWQANGLLRNNDDNPGALNCVQINAPLYWTGLGELTITKSVINDTPTSYGGPFAGSIGPSVAVGSHGCDVRIVTCTSTQHAAIVLTDSTVSGIAPQGQDVSPVQSFFTGNLQFLRDDLSGYPQGVDPGDNSTIKQVYIHNIRQPDQTTNAHIDGIFIMGSNVILSQIYLDGTGITNGPSVTTGIFCQDTGSTVPFTGVKLYASYLSMANGNVTLRNQDCASMDVINNTFAVGYSAQAHIADGNGTGGTWGTLSGNKFDNNTPLNPADDSGSVTFLP